LFGLHVEIHRPGHIFLQIQEKREYIWPKEDSSLFYFFWRSKEGSSLIWPSRSHGAVRQRARSNLTDSPAHALHQSARWHLAQQGYGLPAASINFIQSSPPNRHGYNKIFHSINNEHFFLGTYTWTVLFNGQWMKVLKHMLILFSMGSKAGGTGTRPWCRVHRKKGHLYDASKILKTWIRVGFQLQFVRNP